ncbi:hypothetical protein JCM3765_003838 [Sporobolomyces pararoseus]
MAYMRVEGVQDYGTTIAERWYLEVLKSCPLLRHCEFNVSSVNMVRSVAEAILEAVPTITSIKFFDYTNSRIESESTLSETHQILGSLFSKPLLYAESSYLKWDEEDGACTASLSIAVRAVDVTTTLGSLNAVLPLLPASTITPPLRRLKIHFDGEVPSDLGKLEIIGRRAGSSLQGLTLNWFARSAEVHLSSYGRHHSGSAVPSEAFLLFPVLKTLILRHTHGPSLALIETLATRSPLLEDIDFHYSCWVSSSAPRSIRPHEIFPERQILACLLRFKHLKMSLISLPEDVLNVISENVGNEEKYANVLDLGSLSKLCLVCRKLLPSARRALYASPFSLVPDDLLPLSFDIRPATAMKLLDSLRGNQNRLGRLVRSTEGLCKWVSDYMADEGEGEQGSTEAEDWYIKALKACPSINHLEFNVCTSSLIRRVSGAISQALPTIDSVMFFTRTNSTNSKASLPTLYKALTPLFTRPLSKVDFSFANFSRLKSATDASFPIAVDELKLATEASSFESVLPFFPPSTTSHPLRRLHLAFQEVPDSEDLPLIARRVGSSLESLMLEHYEEIPSIRLAKYGRKHPGFSLPLQTFDSFPALKRLILYGTRGPSVRLVETLVSNSPLLENVDFQKSCWISDSDPLSTVPDEVFPEQQIVSSLFKMEHLRYIDFGILPTVDGASYQGMRGKLEEKGIKFEIEVCERQGLLALPQTALDFIAHEVGNCEGKPNVVDFKSLYNLCLVCRTLLHAARQALYYSPFALSQDDALIVSMCIRPDTILRIVWALQRDGGHLGELVKSTMGISRLMIDYMMDEGQAEKGPAEADESTSTPSNPVHHSNTSISTSVTLFTETNSTDSKATLPTLYKNLPNLFTGSLRSIKFDFVNMAPLKKAAEASLPLATEHLEITTSSTTFDSVLPLPPPSSTLHPLHSFDLLFYRIPDTKTFPLLLQRAGSALQSLKVGLRGRSPEIYLTSYGVRHLGLKIPIDAFLNFPHLKNLSLPGTRPSLQLLESLSLTSPLLEEISFDESCWISFGSPTSIIPEEIVPEEVALETLSKFKNLRKINLGYLPTTEKTSYRMLQEGLKERGIEFEFEVCSEGDEPEPERKFGSDSDDELDISKVYVPNGKPWSSGLGGPREEDETTSLGSTILSSSDIEDDLPLYILP